MIKLDYLIFQAIRLDLDSNSFIIIIGIEVDVEVRGVCDGF